MHLLIYSTPALRTGALLRQYEANSKTSKGTLLEETCWILSIAALNHYLLILFNREGGALTVLNISFHET